MGKESFESSDGGGSHRSESTLTPDFTSANNVQMFRTVDQSLNFSSDSKYLIFDQKCLYPNGNHQLPTSEEFDTLNTHHSRHGRPESLSNEEVTKGAFDIVVASNTNGNDKVDLNEWLNVAPIFGYDKQEAKDAYAQGVQEANDGKSLYQITQDLITPKIMNAADTDEDGRINRREFDQWVDEILEHLRHPNDPDNPLNFPPMCEPPEVPEYPAPYIPPIEIPNVPIDVPIIPSTDPFQPIDLPVTPFPPVQPIDVPVTPPPGPIESPTAPAPLPTDVPPTTPDTKPSPTPTPNKGTDLTSLITAGDSGVTSQELQHARDIANALPENMKKTLLANHIRLSVQSGFTAGEAQGQNSGIEGMFYADSGMADQSEVHELYEMYGQLTSNGPGSWSDAQAVRLADSGIRAAGQAAYYEGDLNDTIGSVQGDGDHLSNAFAADFFATHPDLLQDRYGQDTLIQVAKDDPTLTAYVAQATGLQQAQA